MAVPLPAEGAGPRGAECPMCGSPLGDLVDPTDPYARCTVCGMHLGATAKASPFGSRWLWGFVLSLAAVYVMTVAVVAAAG